MEADERFLFRSTLALAFAGVGAFAVPFLISMAPAADAYDPLVVHLSTIGPGERLTVTHRGTAYFILHRTQAQIALARADDEAPMPSPERDAARVQRPDWLIVEARPENSFFYPASYQIRFRGKYGGWFAPLGDQHYDLSGRLREGYRATRNLPVPEYYFLSDEILVIEKP